MGSFVFKWEHPADEVYVTGTFDDWSKSERLDKTEVNFAKRVMLPNTSQKIYYKFVVDGNWITDHTAPQEEDESGNVNNVLTTDQITRHIPDMAGIISGVSPSSTTAVMAGAVPLEKDKYQEPSGSPETFPRVGSIISGVTPSSTTAIMAGAVPLEKDKYQEPSESPETFSRVGSTISGVTPSSTSAMMAGTVPLEKDQTRDEISTTIVEDFSKTAFSGVSPNSTTAIMAGAVPLEKDKYQEPSGSPETFPRVGSIISGVTPSSTSAIMAGAVPLEKDAKKESSGLPGTFPGAKGSISGVTPSSTSAIMAGAVPLEKDTKKESSGLPGTFPGAKGSISGVTPSSTSAIMAGAVPLEKDTKKESSGLPGTFPGAKGSISGVTPCSTSAIMAGAVPLEKDAKKESSGLPGTFPGAKGSISEVFTTDTTSSAMADNAPLEEGSAALPGSFPEIPGVGEKSTSGFDEAINPTSTLLRQNFGSHNTKSNQTPFGHKDPKFNVIEATQNNSISSTVPILSGQDRIYGEQNKTTDNAPILSNENSKILHKIDENNANELITPSSINNHNNSETLTVTPDLQSITNSVTEALLSPSEPLIPAKKTVDINSSIAEIHSTLEPTSKITEIPLEYHTTLDVTALPQTQSISTAHESLVTSEPSSYRDLVDPNDEKYNLSREELEVSGIPEDVNQSSLKASDDKHTVATAQKNGPQEMSELNSQLQNSTGKVSPSSAVSSASVPSRGVSPHTIPTIKAGTTQVWANNSEIATECTATNNTSMLTDAVAGTTGPASFEKTEKKKKRTSIFGKLKAKLTHKDKD
ncbi:hypothetical protein K3495_g1493 [Podosphaera aphanis]|nr:hypothetical protein K3495_g1493 [Podosphaera aphanis]